MAAPAIRNGLGEVIPHSQACTLVVSGGGGAYLHPTPFYDHDMLLTMPPYPDEPKLPYGGYIVDFESLFYLPSS